jgi:pimeloyl-ACP methyl ester carboxylesterase
MRTLSGPAPNFRVALGLFLLLLVALPAGSAEAASPPVAEQVTFAVRNTNGSGVGCHSDGAAAEIKGHLIAPARLLSRPARRRAVTLYLHGLGFGEWFWNFAAAPGYDYAQAQARAGHASVVIDRIGYGPSSRPDGSQTSPTRSSASFVAAITPAAPCPAGRSVSLR